MDVMTWLAANWQDWLFLTGAIAALCGMYRLTRPSGDETFEEWRDRW